MERSDCGLGGVNPGGVMVAESGKGGMYDDPKLHSGKPEHD